MLNQIPNYVNVLFILIVVISIIWFYQASRSKTALIVLCLWAIAMTLLGLSGFLTNFEAMPPRFLIGVIPTILVIFILFLTQKGKAFIDQIDLKSLTYFSVIRIPVEITLALLYHQGAISILQTFEGANFDILSGITAPIIAYLVFTKKSLGRKALLIWNVIALLLLFIIVTISVLCAPSPIQQLSFDQPNIGIFYFPFNLLPSLVVPLVMFSHFVAIQRLIKGEEF